MLLYWDRTNKVPGTAPRVGLQEDELASGTRSTDAFDSGLIQVGDELVVHIVVLVVGIEDDFVVVLEARGNRLPPGLETGYVGDDVPIVSP